MRVLVGCEFSGTVRRAFRERGHDAWSCDLLPADDGSEFHYQMDIFEALGKQKWDLGIFHPPCTYLCNSGVHWLYKDDTRWDKMREGAIFFKRILNSKIPHICVENPIMHKYAKEIIKTDQAQTIQPWQYGHLESKATCLWLKNIPLLKPTNILDKPKSGHWNNQTPSGQNKLAPSKDRWKIRSITYKGIAEAMADQWTVERLDLELC